MDIDLEKRAEQAWLASASDSHEYAPWEEQPEIERERWRRVARAALLEPPRDARPDPVAGLRKHFFEAYIADRTRAQLAEELWSVYVSFRSAYYQHTDVEEDFEDPWGESLHLADVFEKYVLHAIEDAQADEDDYVDTSVPEACCEVTDDGRVHRVSKIRILPDESAAECCGCGKRIPITMSEVTVAECPVCKRRNVPRLHSPCDPGPPT